MNIKKLSIVLLAGVATLVTAIEPSLAAQRKHRAYDAYASGASADRSGAYYFGPGRRGYDAYASGGAVGVGKSTTNAVVISMGPSSLPTFTKKSDPPVARLMALGKEVMACAKELAVASIGSPVFAGSKG